MPADASMPGAAVAWSSGDSAIARVDRASGQVRGVRSGRVQIVAAHGSGRDSVVITVRRRGARVPAVSSIAIAPLPPLRAGDEATLAAVVLGAKGDTLQGAEITWSLEQPAGRDGGGVDGGGAGTRAGDHTDRGAQRQRHLARGADGRARRRGRAPDPWRASDGGRGGARPAGTGARPARRTP